MSCARGAGAGLPLVLPSGSWGATGRRSELQGRAFLHDLAKLQVHTDLQRHVKLFFMTTDEGLRELKKRRTRREIVVATLELSLEGSYRATTIPLIAERAMVSPRTVSTYF